MPKPIPFKPKKKAKNKLKKQTKQQNPNLKKINEIIQKIPLTPKDAKTVKILLRNTIYTSIFAKEESIERKQWNELNAQERVKWLGARGIQGFMIIRIMKMNGMNYQEIKQAMQKLKFEFKKYKPEGIEDVSPIPK